LDTAHAFEFGYNLKEKKGLEKSLDEFDREIGLEKLLAVHANDSKTPFLSGLDRHENIGEGSIGLEGFRLIVNHPSLSSLPFIIETPGFARRGPDRKNIEILRDLSNQV